MGEAPMDWRVDPESNMPPDEQTRHHDWCEAARYCYSRRNEAEEAGQASTALDYHECGDIYLERALAMSAEWE